MGVCSARKSSPATTTETVQSLQESPVEPDSPKRKTLRRKHIKSKNIDPQLSVGQIAIQVESKKRT